MQQVRLQGAGHRAYGRSLSEEAPEEHGKEEEHRNQEEIPLPDLR